MVITRDMLKSLIRWDISWDEFWGDEDWEEKHEYEQYQLTWEDVDVFLENVKRRNPRICDLYEAWGLIFDCDDVCVLDNDSNWMSTFHAYYASSKKQEETDIICDLLDNIGSVLEIYQNHEDYIADGPIELDRILSDVERLKKGEDVDINFGIRWTEDGRVYIVRNYFSGQYVPSETGRKDVLRFLDELCANDNIDALDMKAYLCYGGSELMPCDWFASRDCLLRLMELTEDTGDARRGQYANTLGYMYYYGRCSDGVPDYETALKYYVIGGAYGLYESIYKIADMMKSGKVLPKDRNASKRLVERVYELTKKEYLRGSRYSDFADAAFRMGIFAREDEDYETALKYLQESECAIRDRYDGGFYGDDRVAMAITKNLREVKAECEEREKKDASDTDIFPDEPDFSPLSYLVEIGSVIKCRMTRKSDDEIVLEFRDDGDLHPSSVFVDTKERGMLHLARFSYVFHGVKDLKIGEKSRFRFARFDSYYWMNPMTIRFFTYEGKEKCSFTYEKAELVLPDCDKPKSDERHLFVSCSFYDGGRTYDYIADGFDVEVGDIVIVNSYQGEAEVQVESIEEKTLDELPIPFERYKPILRVLDDGMDTEQ